MWLWPVATASGVAFVMFCSNRRGLPYAVFVACATLCLTWFLSEKLSHVVFHFARANLALTNVLGLLAAVFVGAFFLIGLLLGGQQPKLNDTAMLVYSCSFALAEWLLAYGHGSEKHMLQLYPEYLILVTSAAGLYLCYVAYRSAAVLSRGGALAAGAVWLAKCGAIVCHAEDSFTSDMVTVLLLWSLAPFAFYWPTPRHLSQNRLVAHLASVLIALFVASSSALAECVGVVILPGLAVFNPLVLHGLAVAAFGFVCLVVALRFYPLQAMPRALALFVMLSAAVFVAFQPGVFHFEGEWLLVATILWISAALFIPWVRDRVCASAVALHVFSIGAGLLGALYFNAGDLYHEWDALAVVFLLTCIICFSLVGEMICVATLQINGDLRGRFWAYVLLFPLLYLLAAWGLGGVGQADQLVGLRLSLLSFFCTSHLVLALVVAVQAGGGVISVSSGNNTSAVGSGARLGGGLLLSRSKDANEKRKSALKTRTAGDESLAGLGANLSAEEAYSRRSVGNLAMVLCFIVASLISYVHLDGTSLSAVFLSPLLLFLSNDRGPFSFVSSQSPARYLPMIVCIFASFLFFSLYHAFDSASPWKNGFLVLLSVPSIFFSISNVAQKSASAFWLYFTLPGSIFFLLLSDVWPERLYVPVTTLSIGLFVFLRSVFGRAVKLDKI